MLQTMPQEAAFVLSEFGRSDLKDVSSETVEYLFAQKLMAKTRDVLSGKKIVVLTAEGKLIQRHLWRMGKPTGFTVCGLSKNAPPALLTALAALAKAAHAHASSLQKAGAA